MAVNWGFQQFKSSFFDREAVLKKVDSATRQVLSRAGAFIRTRAKSSIRKRKKAAPPGQPPSSHTGVLKNLIFFAYDSASKSVVIGPAKSNQRNAFAIESGGSVLSIPGVLEFGGKVGLHEHFLSRFDGGSWIRTNFRARPGNFRSALSLNCQARPTRIRVANYEPRPFMTPAGNAELPRLRGLLRNMVR